jgi:hypothetical protein
MQGLGWKQKEDPRNADHRLKALLPRREVPLKNVTFPMFGYPLDQGQTGTCVGHAAKHWELTAPIIRTKRLGPPTAIDMYLAASKRDEWHGGQPDTTLQDGTSLTAVMLALRDDFHMISEFKWTDKVDEILQYLCMDGANSVVLGLPWKASMFTTDENGFLHVDRNSEWVGGHALDGSLLRVAEPGHIGGPNSWGRPADFGKLNKKTGMRDGRWRLYLDDLHYLMGEGGDCVAAFEVR